MQFLTAMVVLAEEEGSSSNVDLVLPETAELIAGIIAFSIVFFFVWKWAWPTMNKTLEQRQAAMTGKIEEADRAKVEAESLLADYKSQLSEAKTEGNRIIEDARVTADQMKSDMMSKAEGEAENIRVKAREDAASEKSRALADARTQVGDISVDLAGKIVGESLDADAHQALIDRYLADLESLYMQDRIAGYANGIFELARAEDELGRVEAELFSVAQALDGSSELRSTLTDPQMPIDKKQAIVDDLLGERASSLTVGLVQLMVSQGRASELPAVAQAVVGAAAASRDKAVAEVRSAVPLDATTVERLAAGLSRATGKTVEVKVIVDESVIGGISARVGDTVIDGSLARRVDSLRQAINS